MIASLCLHVCSIVETQHIPPTVLFRSENLWVDQRHSLLWVDWSNGVALKCKSLQCWQLNKAISKMVTPISWTCDSSLPLHLELKPFIPNPQPLKLVVNHEHSEHHRINVTMQSLLPRYTGLISLLLTTDLVPLNIFFTLIQVGPMLFLNFSCYHRLQSPLNHSTPYSTPTPPPIKKPDKSLLQPQPSFCPQFLPAKENYRKNGEPGLTGSVPLRLGKCLLDQKANNRPKIQQDKTVKCSLESHSSQWTSLNSAERMAGGWILSHLK